MATYYVDATGGDDGALGTSPETAWQTWNKARGITYSAGDIIKFNRGDTWSVGNNGYWAITEDGTAENYITIDAYGTGTKPIIDCEEEFNGKTWTEETGVGANIWSTPFTVQVYRVRFDGQDSGMATTSAGVDGSTYLWHWNTTDDKLFVYATENPNTAYTNIKVAQTNRNAFDMNGCDYIKIQNLRIHGGKFAVYFYPAATTSYIEFNDCDFWYGYNAITCSMTAGGGGTTNYITLDGNDFDSKPNYISTAISNAEDCVYDAVTIDNECNNWTIQNNTFTGWCHNHLSLMAKASSSQGINNCIIQNNTFDGSGTVYVRAYSVSGIDGKAVGNIFRYNIIHDTNCRIQFGGNDNEFYYNIIYHIVDCPATNKSDVSEGLLLTIIDPGMVCVGALIYNNTFYDTYDESISIGDPTGTCLIKNNILSEVQGNYPNAVMVWIASTTGHTVSNNCLYDSDSSSVVWIEDDSAYRTVAYCDTNYAAFSSNVGSDPLMTDPANDDFTLQITSPCLNAGTNVSLTTDYAGNSVGVLPDIGAYEHQGVRASPGQNGIYLSMGMSL